MPIYHLLGRVPPKRHTVARTDKGTLLHEELVGNKGFSGPSSLLYHLRPPTRVRSVTRLHGTAPTPEPDPTLRPRHFRTERLPKGGSPTLDRVPLLFNADVQVSFVEADTADAHFWRNGEADELLFVVGGKGVLESPFGRLAVAEGDQVVVHRGIPHRLVFQGHLELLVVESRGYVRWPQRYLAERGQLREGAPFCERDVKRPTELFTVDEEGDFEILVKQHGALHRVVLAHHPCDVVGWDGFYYPWAFDIHDFEPITGAIHQPPPVHQFVEGDGWVVCNFLPRPFDFHPQAVPAPYNHANVMSDEVLYYASREFMSRKGIERGSLTLHPDGLPHGPHPGRYEASIGVSRTDELAFMLDTFRPLHVAREALAVEDADYGGSWLEG